jgi:UDP-N-acetylmuramoyl-L-alanyl-D-glutamate--2,6-diaminopimelate ligase
VIDHPIWKLFDKIAHRGYKKIFPHTIGIFNADDPEVAYYSSFPIEKKYFYSCQELESNGLINREKNQFIFKGNPISVQLPGYFNIYNAVAGATVGEACGLDGQSIARGIEHLAYIPGRMERVDLGQNFTVFIDYAHEQLSMRNLLETLTNLRNPGANIILLFGAEGGGRDTQKRQDMGILAHNMADTVIITTVDPYDDDPKQIIDDIAQYVVGGTKIIDDTVFLIEDRKQAIDKAFSLAKENDIVCICGKGAERSMVIAGQTIPWDEQIIVRDILKKYV